MKPNINKIILSTYSKC